MYISDEQLSAFLDAELPPGEMEFIRQQLSEDENLTNRLAELAMVDEKIASHYTRIDEQPMPDAITHLLDTEKIDSGSIQHFAQSSTQTSATVIVFPLWKRIHSTLQKHAAMAASIALVIGFGVAQILPGDNNSIDHWNAVAQALDGTRSGDEQTLADGSLIKPRLSFINRDGNYCRQFQIINNQRSAENIACHIDNHWQPSMTVYSQVSAQRGDYQTASGGSVLDNALDEMMYSEAFDAAAEADAIKNHWNRHQ